MQLYAVENNMEIKVGIDVGNYDTKTQNTSTPSKFNVYNVKPLMAEEIIFYNGLYYNPCADRSGYVVDKTKDDIDIILSLFGIAKEILFSIKKRFPGCSQTRIQEEISKINIVHLGIGLPPAYLSVQSSTTKNHYISSLANGIKYTFNGFEFSFKLGACTVFPQDFTAVFTDKKSEIVNNFEKYYIVGIGGGTIDIIPVVKGVPDTEKCTSLDKGTKILYSSVVRRVKTETNIALEPDDVERVLMGKAHVLPASVVKSINDATESFVNDIFYECKQIGLEFRAVPCVFIGGGCLLLRKYIENNPILSKFEIFDDVHANAKRYAEFLKIA